LPKSKLNSAAELDEQIGFKLRLAQLAVFGDIIDALKSCELRPVDLSALLIIEANPGVRQHVIGDRLKIARPNIVALIDSLSERQLVERVVDARDRRANQLRLTEQGLAMLEKGKTAQALHREKLFRALDGVDVDNFVRGLDKLMTLD
jgi:DNA-binding MarR family transcriptional regulator